MRILHTPCRGFIASALLSAVLSACAQPTQEPQEPPDDASVERVKALEDQLAVVENEMAVIEITDRRHREKYAKGVFDPSESTYQRIDVADGFGSFAVSVQDVQPFGDGVRVKLHLGNLTTADFDNVKLQVVYAPRAPELKSETLAAYNKWLEEKKSKNVELTTKLKAGSWNPTTVALPGIAADRFGYIEVSIETNTISLRPN
jgi:hypothetical protein